MSQPSSNHRPTRASLAARSRALLLLMACTFGSVVLGQQQFSNTETAIRALEKQWTYAQGHNDNRALDLIFDNALVYVEYGRLVSKGEYLARIKREVPSSDEIVMDPVTVRTFEDTAVVIGTYREKKLQRGQRETKRWRFIDTWIYKKNGWVLVAAASTPLR